MRDDQDGRLPHSAKVALLEMADQIERLTERVEVLDSKIIAAVKADDAGRWLTTIPGVGPIIAATVRTAVQNPAAFRTGTRFGGLDRHHTKGEFQWRKGEARQDLKAGQ